MPYDWVEPEVFLTYGPHKVYHIYRHDQFQDCQRDNWYSLSMFGSDDDCHGQSGTFDVRELPFTSDLPGEKGQRHIIRQALGIGYFDDWEVDGARYGDLIAARQADAADGPSAVG